MQIQVQGTAPQQGYQEDHKARAAYRSNDLKPQNKLAIYFIEKLQQQGGRTTAQIMKLLNTVSELPQSWVVNQVTGESYQVALNVKQFGAVVRIARQFVRTHENGDIVALPEVVNKKTIFRYSLIWDPSQMIRRVLEKVKQALSLATDSHELMEIISRHSLNGNEAAALETLDNFVRVVQAAAKTTQGRVEAQLPGSVYAAAVAARKTSLEERLGLLPASQSDFMQEVIERSERKKGVKTLRVEELAASSDVQTADTAE